jgi:hypothetical protein
LRSSIGRPHEYSGVDAALFAFGVVFAASPIAWGRVRVVIWGFGIAGSLVVEEAPQ